MSFSSDITLLYSIFCVFIAFLYSLLLYNKDKLSVNISVLRILSCIRFIIIITLLLLLFNPFIKSINKYKERPIIIILQDVSSSVKENMQSRLDDLSLGFNSFDVFKYSFDSKIREGFSNINNGVKTNISSALNDIDSRFYNRNISALILATDGLYNEGLNPLYRDFDQYPIYPIALGDTNIKKHISVIEVKNNKVTFLGNTFPLEVAFSASQLKGERVSCLLINNGKKLYSNIFNVDSDEYYKNFQILLEAEDIGLQKYTIELSVVGKQDDLNCYYNSYIDVIESRYNILLLNSISHPDIAAYKRVVVGNNNYKVDSYNIADFNKDIESYQLIVLFGIDVNVNNQLIDDINDSKIPLLIFHLNKLGLKENISTSIQFQKQGDLDNIFASADNNFSKFVLSDSLLYLINGAPPLSALFGDYIFSDNIDLLLVQRLGDYITNKPIIAISEEEERKIAYVDAEGFWKWKLYNYSNTNSHHTFNDFFEKITHYLVLKEDRSRFRIDYEKEFLQGENISFDAFLFNKSFERISDNDIELILVNDQDVVFNFDFSKRIEDNSYFLDMGKLEVGEYSFHARVQGTSLYKEGRFNVKEVYLEKIYNVANHNILSYLAENSGGKMFYKNYIDSLFYEINNNEISHSVVHMEEKMNPIISIPFILLFLLLLCTIEWLIRKYHGLV